MICGGVLVPEGDTWRRRCFVEERYDGVNIPPHLLVLTRDHYVPRSQGGADGPVHPAHAYCQAVQGGLIGGPIVGPITGPINGRRNVESGQLARARVPFTTEQRMRGGRTNVESGTLARARHARWHTNRGITNPACEFCTTGTPAPATVS